jgi:hypothetical protein
MAEAIAQVDETAKSLILRRFLMGLKPLAVNYDLATSFALIAHPP